MLSLALNHNPGWTRLARWTGASVTIQTARRIAIAVLISVCVFAQTTGFPATLQRLGAPFPLQLSAKTEVASIGIHRDGRLMVYFAPMLANSTDGDLLAFLYLHEVGHARLGHLRPEDPNRMRFSIPGMSKGVIWQMEYDADAWAARQALALGFDPVHGITTLFARFGDGGGLTHPPDKVRIARVRKVVDSLR